MLERNPVPRQWTRREFLKVGLEGSAVVGGGVVAGIGSSKPSFGPQSAKTPSFGLSSHERELLRAAMDEIIPPSDGAPSASQVGGVDYLDLLVHQVPELKRRLEKTVAALEEASGKRFGRGFLSLKQEQRVQLLREMETRTAPEFFSTLRNCVYEAYYTRPQVWKRIGYEFHATDQSGPRMKPFDERLLARVRRMPRLYREVS